MSPPLPPAPSQPAAGLPPGAGEGSFRLVNGSSPSNGILEVMWQCRYRKVCSDIWWGDIFNQDWPQAVSQNLGAPYSSPDGYSHSTRCLAAHVCASLGQPVSGSVLRYVYLDYRDRPLPPLFVPISGSCMAANESLELVDGTGRMAAAAAEARAAAADSWGRLGADATLRRSPAYLAVKYRDPRLAQWQEEPTRCA